MRIGKSAAIVMAWVLLIPPAVHARVIGPAHVMDIQTFHALVSRGWIFEGQVKNDDGSVLLRLTKPHTRRDPLIRYAFCKLELSAFFADPDIAKNMSCRIYQRAQFPDTF